MDSLSDQQFETALDLFRVFSIVALSLLILSVLQVVNPFYQACLIGAGMGASLAVGEVVGKICERRERGKRPAVHAK